MSQTTPQPQPERGAFDRQASADYLSISTRLLDDLAKQGTIRRLKQGRKSLFRKIDLDAYLAELAGEAPQTGTQQNFEFAIVFQAVWSDRNDLKIAKGQVALLAALIAANDHLATLDDATANLSEKFDDDGKWRGHICLGLSQDGLIETVGAENSKRTSRNAGLLRRWRLVDVAKAKLKIESLQRWIDGIEKPAVEGGDNA